MCWKSKWDVPDSCIVWECNSIIQLLQYSEDNMVHISKILSATQNTLNLLTLQDNPGVVTCMDNQPHGLQTGQSVVFREVNGMVELNSSVRQVSGIMSTSEPITSHPFLFLKSFY